MLVERIVSGVTTLGPGKRIAIWVNGCNRACPGCISPRLQKFDESTECNIIDILGNYDLVNIDGITISGGEPFEQIDDLYDLVCFLNEKNIEDILIYSGYTYSDLLAMNSYKVTSILEKISVLIDGPYLQELNYNDDNLKGSKNQNIIILNKKYEEDYKTYNKNKRDMQVFELGNKIVGVGIPDKKFISEFLKK